MSRRHEQLASTMRRALQEVIDRGLADPRVSGLVTVTGVRVTEDLRQAIVQVSVMPADRQDLTMHGLRSAAGKIRRELFGRLAARHVPEVVFRLDESLKRQAGVLGAISRAAAEREARGEAPPDEAAPQDEGTAT